MAEGASTSGGVDLTPLETRIFETLLGACEHHGASTTLRVAGGWVRDKVLGLQSGDIDIALDDSMGAAFAARVNEYLTNVRGEAAQSVGVIMANPEQSKHLETATMKVHGQWIDFVNLRTESYADSSSRIPEIGEGFGTPEQDAYRRDLTINALFYNINTGCVEDYTGQGLSDLRAGIVRTPLPPKETFLDDPLRVLRAVRFAARLGFELDDALAAAMEREDVLKALEHKVSRERIGTEVEGMIRGPNVARAIRLLERHGVLSVVVGIDAMNDVTSPVAAASSSPASASYSRSMSSTGAAAVEELQELLSALPPSFSASDISTDTKKAAYLAALLLGVRQFSYAGPKKKRCPLAQGVILEKMKLSKKDAEAVVTVHESLPEMFALLRRITSVASRFVATEADDPSSPSLSEGDTRREAGLLIRKLKGNWISALLTAPLMAQANASDGQQQGADGNEPTPSAGVSITEWAAACAEFRVAIEAAGLAEAWSIKPLLSGKEVMSSLGMSSGGPMLGVAMNRLMEWQLENPCASKEDCNQWLNTSLKSELKL